MRQPWWLVAVVAVVAIVGGGGCSLTDLNGFSIGAAAEGGDASTTPVDGGGAPSDAGGDASNGLDGSIPTGTFVDDFERPDGVVGNGWKEKVGGTFTLLGGRVRMTPGNHQNLVLTRPVSDDVRDVEAAIEVVYTATTAGSSSDAYVFARIQRATLGSPDNLDGYTGYLADFDKLRIGRSRGPGIVTIAEAAIPTVDTSHVYRVRLRVRGASPVSLYAAIDRRAFGSAAWTVLAETELDDAQPERIDGAGATGVASDTVVSCAIDSFSRTNL